MPLPYGSGPPWAPGGTPPPGIPPAPPPIAAAQPQTPPYVGNLYSLNTAGNVTSVTFPFSANAGDGIVLYVFSPGSGVLSATATYGGIAGDTFIAYPTSAASITASTFLLWCPVLTGTNPTITLKSNSSEHIALWAAQIVGANPGWFVDQIATLHMGAGSSIVQPVIRTTSPNDLILIGGSPGSAVTSITPAGYAFQSLFAVAGTGYIFCIGYGPPQPNNSAGPAIHYTSAQAGAITIAIRTGVNAPSHYQFPSKFSLLAPGYVPSPPYPATEAVTSPNVTVSLSGQTASFTEGTILPEVDYSLTGQTATFTEGTIGPEADYGLTAQTATFTEGTITEANDGSATFSAQTASFTVGTITATGGDVGPVTPPSQAGGTGIGARRKLRYAKDIFREELERIEAQLREATEQRVEVEEKLAEISEEPSKVSPEVLRYIVNFERALKRAQEKEKKEQSLEVPVYFRLPAKSPGVRRIEAYQRLKMLSELARHREQVAIERLRKVREQIDLDAATYFMNFIMWED